MRFGERLKNCWSWASHLAFSISYFDESVLKTLIQGYPWLRLRAVQRGYVVSQNTIRQLIELTWRCGAQVGAASKVFEQQINIILDISSFFYRLFDLFIVGPYPPLPLLDRFTVLCRYFSPCRIILCESKCLFSLLLATVGSKRTYDADSSLFTKTLIIFESSLWPHANTLKQDAETL